MAKLQLLGILIIVLISGCTAPRGITASGKVTPKGAFKAGTNFSFNIATAPLAEIDDLTAAAVDAIDNSSSDSVVYNDAVESLIRSLVAYSLDPVSGYFDFYVRYGVAKRFDAGYRYASGVHVLDAMYQFLGSTGTPDNPGNEGIYGSIGLQYSGQKSNLPEKLGLDKLSSIFEYNLSRKDILVPVIFSLPFGPEETYGNISFGFVYGHTFIKYGFNPTKTVVKYTDNSVETLLSFEEKTSFSSFGSFINAKIGYKHVYVLPALTVYHQNYGTYNIFGLQKESFKGLTFIPSLGLQFNLGYKKAGEK